MASSNKIIIGTRGSQLAMCQAEWVKQALRRFTSTPIILKTIKTKGDKMISLSLIKNEGKGLFVTDIENELKSGKIDLAVHSLKDMPIEIPNSLAISAIPKRADPHDVLVSRNNLTLSKLPRNAIVGTSSLRRKAQIRRYRPDLKLVDIRGNVDTRLKKLDRGEYDAIVMAAAGLIRLGAAHRITEFIPWKICFPAVGQGALAIETRKDDKRINELVSRLNHKESRLAAFAERSLLEGLGGGCQMPLGAVSEIKDKRLKLQGLIIALNGKKVIKGSVSGSIEKSTPEELGVKLAKQLLNKGAGKILESLSK
jgi:hydroxymethylbilane synthase